MASSVLSAVPGDQVVAATTATTVIINLANWALTAYAWPDTGIPAPVEAAIVLVISAGLGYGAVLLTYWKNRLAPPAAAPSSVKSSTSQDLLIQ
jgi:hypothetical protein